MANTESTAVNALIELSNQRPVDLGLGGDPFANSFGANAAHRNAGADVEVDMSADAFDDNPRTTMVGMPGPIVPPRRPSSSLAAAMPPPLPAVLRPSRQMAASDVTMVNTAAPAMAHAAHADVDENWGPATQVSEPQTEPVVLGYSESSAMQPKTPPMPMARNRVPASTTSMPFAAQAQQFNEAASSRASQSFGVPALTSFNQIPQAPVLPVQAAVPRPAPSRAGSDTQLVAPLPPPTATEMATTPRQLIEGGEWFESTQAVPRVADEYDVNTHGVKHARRTSPVVIGAVAGAAVLGALAGGYFFFGLGQKPPATIATKATAKTVALNGAMPAAAGQDNNAAPAIAPIAAAPTAAPIAPAAVAAVAAPAPTVTPIEAAPVSPLSDVTFTSQPAGANVVIVDDGKPMQLGKTPITASIDVHKAYDVVFALDGHPTKMATLAVGATNIAADLDSAAPAVSAPAHVTAKPVAVAAVAPVAKTEEPAPTTHKKAKHEQVEEAPVEKKHAKRVAEADEAPAPTKSKKAAKSDAVLQALAAPKGPAGTLMIASKPPCAISVDGKSTGLTTPQRDLQLAAGTHTISLVNAENGIRKSVKVTIVSGKATKAMLDFTSLLNDAK